jgi:hypothetical protein
MSRPTVVLHYMPQKPPKIQECDDRKPLLLGCLLRDNTLQLSILLLRLGAGL